jgi:hypothetical protein
MMTSSQVVGYDQFVELGREMTGDGDIMDYARSKGKVSVVDRRTYVRKFTENSGES